MLVSVALVNNEIGTIQDLASISALCRDTGAILHSDFAQAPSAVNLLEYADLADMVSLSGHKFGGPMGVGALYVSRELKDRIEPLFHGGGQEGGLRPGTLPLPLCVGLGSAAEFHASEAGTALRARVAGLRDLFVHKLQSNHDRIGLNGDKLRPRHSGNANLRFEGRDAEKCSNDYSPSCQRLQARPALREFPNQATSSVQSDLHRMKRKPPYALVLGTPIHRMKL